MQKQDARDPRCTDVSDIIIWCGRDVPLANSHTQHGLVIDESRT